MYHLESILLSIIMDLSFFCPIWLIIPLILSLIYEIKHKIPAWNIIQEIVIIPLLFWINVSIVQVFFEPPSHHFLMIIMFSEPFTIGFSIMLWFFLLFRMMVQRKKPLYPQKYITCIIWAIFLITAIICNSIYLPDMIKETRDRNILDAITVGNVTRLQHIIKKDCPDNQTNTPYLISFTSRQQNMAHYLLMCLKKNNDHKIYANTLIDLLTNNNDYTEIQQNKLINEILTTQYIYLTLQDKQQLVKTLSQTFEDNDRPLTAITLYLTTQKEDLKQLFAQNLPKLSDEQKNDFFQYGDKEAILLMQHYNLDNLAKLQHILLVLNHQNSELQTLLFTTPTILQETIYIDNDLKQSVSLGTYIFQYGNDEIITYLLNHNLINPIDYNHFDSDNKMCSNSLYILLLMNQNIVDKKQKSDIQNALKKYHACGIHN